MSDHNESNERIKRKYFTFLKEAKRHSEDTVDAVAKAISRFEEYAKYRDFRSFHFEQAIAFKRCLAAQNSYGTGAALSKSTQYSTLTHLKQFFQWLALQPGYKSRIQYTDAEYFNLSEKDSRVAAARRDRPAPTLEQIDHVIDSMRSGTAIERRDRALIAFIILTGARDSAVASMKLKHVDIAGGCVYQDAREVRTKFSKTFPTYFFPVGTKVREIVEDWVRFLRTERFWGKDDPLFPATRVALGASQRYEAQGLSRDHWSSAAPIRAIFRKAFRAAGLDYFNPHSFRKTLVRLGEELCRTPEQFKAWSQNLGHEGVLTTFRSYGEVQPDRQRALLKSLSGDVQTPSPDVKALARAIAEEINVQRGTPT